MSGKIVWNVRLVIMLFVFGLHFLSMKSYSSEIHQLHETRVDIPWKVFEELRQKKTDTVIIKEEQNPPSEIVFNKTNVFVEIIDSTAYCKLLADYTVLGIKKWAGVVLFDSSVSFSRIQCSGRDYVISTDSGYVLFTENNKGNNTRNILCEWIISGIERNGLQEITIPLPMVSYGTLTLSIPHKITNVTADDYILISESKTKNHRILKYALSPTSNPAVIRYALPQSNQDKGGVDIDTEDGIGTEIDGNTGQVNIKNKKISTTQQSVLIVNSGSTMCLTALTLTVNNTVLSSFNVKIPGGYSVLRIEGNGIKKWSQKGSDLIKIDLLFDLTDSYTAVFVMESESDTGGVIPVLNCVEASSHSGSFAISPNSSDEVIFTSTGNCLPLPANDFIEDLHEELLESISNLKGKGFTFVEKTALIDNPTAGYFYNLPVNAQFKVKHHKAVPVANAIADSVRITSCLTDDWKLITQADYYLVQRNRKFIVVSLPDTCDIWQIRIDGENRTPFIDEKGKIRLALPKNGSINKQSHVVSIIYFQKYEKKGYIKMYAPVPDIPVSDMSWLVFYGSNNHVAAVDGDFNVTEGGIFKRRIQKGSLETRQLYESIKKSSAEQKIPLLSEAYPKHIFGRKILVVEENPVLILQFGKKEYTGYIVIVLVGVVVVAGIGIAIRRKSIKR